MSERAAEAARQLTALTTLRLPLLLAQLLRSLPLLTLLKWVEHGFGDTDERGANEILASERE